MSVFQLSVGAQCYDWGKLGLDSKVAQFAQCSPEFTVNEAKPYAELWMGTHPSLASKVFKTGETLKTHLTLHPELLGAKVRAKFGDDLPFLFKVLAIRKALSIQAHPDKALAQKLHKERPDIYKDGNHKPEMAVAITDFCGFCGFLPVEKIAEYLSFVPELTELVSKPIAEAFRMAVTEPQPTYETIQACLRDVFTQLMSAEDAVVQREVEKLIARAEDAVVQREVEKLIARYESGEAKPAEGAVKDLAIELSKQYPGDVGIFCVFLLNVVKLHAGQAVFLKANEPHAYIYGDIMECMATSDNVVRAGLTPKLRDVPTLTSMLTYKWGPADSQIMPPVKYRSTKATTIYDPPIEEFSVLLTCLKAGGDNETHEPVEGPSILIVTEGSGRLVWTEKDGSQQEEPLDKPGIVYFVGAGVALSLVAGEGGMTLYRAITEVP
ncbi:Mannose-6-phosphate isomerase [Tulasnella sp. 424]|nr:Mannose-6-phosphate isomerase [Tulasnella sp. 424]KAG8966054.1 Mannose-6-phosphate isomerase [Tulasnella sp. 425]